MKKFLIPVSLFLSVETSFSQTSGYQFTTVVSNKTTPVKDQSSTDTCWCFAATSLMESELLRMGKGEYDLSEMYIVRQKNHQHYAPQRCTAQSPQKETGNLSKKQKTTGHRMTQG